MMEFQRTKLRKSLKFIKFQRVNLYYEFIEPKMAIFGLKM